MWTCVCGSRLKLAPRCGLRSMQRGESSRSRLRLAPLCGLRSMQNSWCRCVSFESVIRRLWYQWMMIRRRAWSAFIGGFDTTLSSVASIPMIQAHYDVNGKPHVYIVTSNSDGAFGYVISVCTISFGLSTVMVNQKYRLWYPMAPASTWSNRHYPGCSPMLLSVSVDACMVDAWLRG